MGNINYKKCRTCRFCIHSGEDWVCFLDGIPTHNDNFCERYRPGSCENCNYGFELRGKFFCAFHAEETDILNVCSDYDPSGKRSV
ncbi:MAG: hypothetical protein FWC44_00575 [Methanomassiliicoccaceae archaeon]|nr:hypothetical protein [Methanomassiliicoccaceae archaeon]